MLPEPGDHPGAANRAAVERSLANMYDRSARVDADAPSAMGRVTCWESGDYYAEVLDIETSSTIYSDHGTFDSAPLMQEKLFPFLRAMGFLVNGQ